MSSKNYTALIRTFNSETTLPGVLSSLARQSVSPSSYVFVDSGSVDRTLYLLPPGAKIHRYSGEKFNFSASLNQGLSFVLDDFVLIISSHTSIGNPNAVEYAIDLLRTEERIGAAYIADDTVATLGYEIIDKNNFDGFNGLHNTCAIVRVSLLKERAFLPEVFSAEDQEWSGWYLNSKEGRIASILGGGMKCANHRSQSPVKKMNEYVAIAYFVNRKFMTWPHIFRLLYCALKLGKGSRRLDRRYYFLLATRLVACHFAKPRSSSKYY